MRHGPCSGLPAAFLLFLGLVALGFAAQAAHGFVEMGVLQPGGAGQPVQLVSLNANMTVAHTQQSFSLGAGVQEVLQVNGFRCRPTGPFCLFTTFDGSTSRLYNVTLATARVTSIFALEGQLRDLHVDLATGAAIAVLTSSDEATVVQILDGERSDVVQLGPLGGNASTFHPGFSTHCSDLQILWVQLHDPAASTTSGATLHQIDLAASRLVQSTNLDQPFAALWASCIDQINLNQVAGALLSRNGSQIAFGLVAKGSGHVETVHVTSSPDPRLRLSGVITEGADTDYVFLMELPPAEGRDARASTNTGVAVRGNFHGTGSLVISKLTAQLIGAARLS
ncbi:uncharacterized protein MONBRDRAFT_7635 [Monosiga brevicollis MX1]|uniref:Uncharacterized protein n=1 Tax=Monosiga brevicollis TaxID=81824 RepID=A9UXV3_MONBE|nr:uncharacterized protein MONBRDRAFT_7635 [Monosiga brevicollis MX1]EDQ89751.1 predicted protein [Monosiga brevicollis MX1]|eukprot:XP_001745173.1 hypothetical protein [Monosiga brevicollis MX1]